LRQFLLTSLAVSLALTLVIEAGFFLLTGKRDRKDLLLLVLANVLTNPVVVLLCWLVALYIGSIVAFVVLPILELSAVFVEGYCYKKCGRGFRRPYLFSLSANAVSFTAGVLIQVIMAIV
jgi:uncharacterized membrane protein